MSSTPTPRPDAANLREQVLSVARRLEQPFLVPDVRTHMIGVSAASIFHTLRDLYDEGVVAWSPSEGYRLV